MAITNITVLLDGSFPPDGWYKIPTAIDYGGTCQTRNSLYIAYEVNGAAAPVTGFGLRSIGLATVDPEYPQGWHIAGNTRPQLAGGVIIKPFPAYFGFTRGASAQWAYVEELNVYNVPHGSQRPPLPPGWAWVQFWVSGNPARHYDYLVGAGFPDCASLRPCLAARGHKLDVHESTAVEPEADQPTPPGNTEQE